jgi:hypothetical protein
MVHARWRIARIRRLELRFLSDAAAEDHQNPDAAILAHMRAKGVDLPTALQRYLNSAERSYYKAHSKLTEGRAQQAQLQAAEARTEAAEACTQAAQARREAEKSLMDFIYAPPPRRPVTIESEEPLSPPRAEPQINATRQSLRAPAL